jgi:hypothetical protein
MTPADIFEIAYRLKVFQPWQIINELAALYEGIFPKRLIKERVNSFLAAQIKNGTIVKVHSDPSIYTFAEFADDWKRYALKYKCRVCGREFFPAMPHQEFCSAECKKKSHNVRRRSYGHRFSKWEPWEIELLLKTFPDFRFDGTKARNLSNQVGRTVEAIRRKLRDIKNGRLKYASQNLA